MRDLNISIDTKGEDHHWELYAFPFDNDHSQLTLEELDQCLYLLKQTYIGVRNLKARKKAADEKKVKDAIDSLAEETMSLPLLPLTEESTNEIDSTK